MKKILSCVLLCAMLLSALSVGIFAAEETAITADTSWYDDIKTEFILTTAEQLAGFNRLMTEGKYFDGKIVKLDKDLDMKNDTGWNSYCIFKGTFDGQGHSISNLTPVKNSGGQRRGMFGYAAGTIRNVTLINPIVGTAATGAVGVVVGDRNQTVLKNLPLTIENVHVVNGTVEGKAGVGGIIGNTNDGDAAFTTIADVVTVKNCSFSGKINGEQGVGGIVGICLHASKLVVENCTFSGSVSGSGSSSNEAFVGGILGYARRSFSIRNCAVKGTVSATQNGVGGLVGYIYNNSITDAAGMTAEVDSCAVNVTVAGAGNHKGGLIGRVSISTSNLTLNVKNCLAEGTITLGANQSYMGGVVAWMHYGTKKLTASFENVISAVKCVSNVGDKAPHSNYKAFFNGNNEGVTVKMVNVYYDSSLLAETQSVYNANITVSDESVNYGAKTTAELQTLKLAGWSNQLGAYPIPSALIEGKTYLVGEQTKSNTDGTTDYRLVAVWDLAEGDSLEHYTDVGFIATLTDDKTGEVLYQSHKVSCRSVYTEVIGTTDQGEKITYTPDQWGGDYLFVLVLEGVESDAEFTLQLIPYVTDSAGNDRLGIETVKKND